MNDNLTIRLRCTINHDDSYTAYASLSGGKQPTGFYVENKTCKDVAQLYNRIKKEFPGATIKVDKPCDDCISG
jgi:hypothetical protein